MNILIIGTGMYVTGRGTETYGTIIPSIIEFQRKTQSVSKIFIVGTNPKNHKTIDNIIKKIYKISGIYIDYSIFPASNSKVSNKEYVKIINSYKIDCAIIALPDHLHYSAALDCIKNKIDCLMVKPFTPTKKEGLKLIDIVEKNKLNCYVEFHKRLDRQNIYLKDIFKTGKLGKPLYTWTEYSQRKTIPSTVFRNWVTKSNILQYLAIHYIDLISFITEYTPTEVSVIGQKKWLVKNGINVHDSVQCNILWEKNNDRFNQVILSNWIDPNNSSAMSDQKIKFVGTEGRFEADQKERGIRTLFDKQNFGTPNLDFCHLFGSKLGEYFWSGYGIDSVTSYLNFIFEKKILNIKNPKPLTIPSFKESIISTKVIESASKSLINGGKIIKI